jgi:hypothetical protein
LKTVEWQQQSVEGSSSRKSRAAWVTALLLGAAAAGLFSGGTSPAGLGLGPVAQAQNFGQRTIHGKVLDDREAPVGGATIFLKNLKTRNVKSFTSTPDGNFRFAQVGMIDDYEVWAERGKTKSAVKSISSFDSRKEVQFDLKLK